jgi:tetratricopeptide (TPR) repeat protein
VGLETGLAAMEAGAVDAAVASLRRTVAQAYEVGEPELQVRALLALGSALVHGVRGRDGEGAGVLLEAIRVAERTADAALAAQAHRELGYVELLRGRYDRAQRWLRTAISLAGGDPAERAWAHAVQGVVLTDIGRHASAIHELREALRLARTARSGSVEVWALTFIGRSHLLRREFVLAREALEVALGLARQLRWTAFVPRHPAPASRSTLPPPPARAYCDSVPSLVSAPEILSAVAGQYLAWIFRARNHGSPVPGGWQHCWCGREY